MIQTKQQPYHVETDAPTCPNCGTLMQRSGSCHTCPECGQTSGCA